MDRDRAQPFLSSEDHWSYDSPAHVLLPLITPVQILLNTLLQGPKYSYALLKISQWCQHQPEANLGDCLCVPISRPVLLIPGQHLVPSDPKPTAF